MVLSSHDSGLVVGTKMKGSSRHIAFMLHAGHGSTSIQCVLKCTGMVVYALQMSSHQQTSFIAQNLLSPRDSRAYTSVFMVP